MLGVIGLKNEASSKLTSRNRQRWHVLRITFSKDVCLVLLELRAMKPMSLLPRIEAKIRSTLD